MTSEVLSVVLGVLGSILLIVLIILGIKLIVTMNKIENVVDDINAKVKSLNGLFTMIDYTTDKLALFSDKFANIISTVIKKIFVRKGEEKDDE